MRPTTLTYSAASRCEDVARHPERYSDDYAMRVAGIARRVFDRRRAMDARAARESRERFERAMAVLERFGYGR